MWLSFTVYSALLLSISFLIAIAFLVAVCTCCKNRESSDKYEYVIDENNGLKKVSVRRLTKVNRKKKNAVHRFTSTNIDFLKDAKMSSDRMPRIEIDGSYFNYVDESDFNSRTDDGKIKIILNTGFVQEDDMMSCNSADSKNTFYSTCPLLRTMSTTETFKSVTSDDEIDV